MGRPGSTFCPLLACGCVAAAALRRRLRLLLFAFCEPAGLGHAGAATGALSGCVLSVACCFTPTAPAACASGAAGGASAASAPPAGGPAAPGAAAAVRSSAMAAAGCCMPAGLHTGSLAPGLLMLQSVVSQAAKNDSWRCCIAWFTAQDVEVGAAGMAWAAAGGMAAAGSVAAAGAARVICCASSAAASTEGWPAAPSCGAPAGGPSGGRAVVGVTIAGFAAADCAAVCGGCGSAAAACFAAPCGVAAGPSAVGLRCAAACCWATGSPAAGCCGADCAVSGGGEPVSDRASSIVTLDCTAAMGSASGALLPLRAGWAAAGCACCERGGEAATAAVPSCVAAASGCGPPSAAAVPADASVMAAVDGGGGAAAAGDASGVSAATAAAEAQAATEARRGIRLLPRLLPRLPAPGASPAASSGLSAQPAPAVASASAAGRAALGVVANDLRRPFESARPAALADLPAAFAQLRARLLVGSCSSASRSRSGSRVPRGREERSVTGGCERQRLTERERAGAGVGSRAKAAPSMRRYCRMCTSCLSRVWSSPWACMRKAHRSIDCLLKAGASQISSRRDADVKSGWQGNSRERTQVGIRRSNTNFAGACHNYSQHLQLCNSFR